MLDETVGKGWRVAGFFTLMVGSGIVLDTGNLAAGAAVLGLGALLFARGAVAGRRAAAELAPYLGERR